MKNMSNSERVIRIVLGVVIIGWGVFEKSWWGAIGLLPLITGLIGFCGMYKLFDACCPLGKDKKPSGCCSKEQPKSKGCCGQ